MTTTTATALVYYKYPKDSEHPYAFMGTASPTLFQLWTNTHQGRHQKEYCAVILREGKSLESKSEWSLFILCPGDHVEFVIPPEEVKRRAKNNEERCAARKIAKKPAK